MKQKILAIDDEPDLIGLLERIIKTKTNYDIVTTNNSLEVPELLKEETFDVIITDLKMPGMDGIEILKWINDNHRSELVIIITAFGSLDTAMEALSLGIFDYITKPFKKEQIIFSLDRAMKYQKNYRDYIALKDIFLTSPYEEALKLFDKKYKEINDI